MAARRDRSGLTAKESKIVSKKSRLFDSKTQGIGLPQKSSKATITGRKPGKPKPTAGKGMNKNIVTKGGKAGRAIENKMRSAMSLPKLQTTGMRKAEKLAFKNTDKISKQGNKEKISGSVKTLKKTIKATTKLEVRGRGLRGGGMLGGGGMSRTNR